MKQYVSEQTCREITQAVNNLFACEAYLERLAAGLREESQKTEDREVSFRLFTLADTLEDLRGYVQEAANVYKDEDTGVRALLPQPWGLGKEAA